MIYFLVIQTPIHFLIFETSLDVFGVLCEMKSSSNSVSILSDSKSISCLYSIFTVTALICGVYFIGSAFLANDHIEILARWNINNSSQNTQSDRCQNSCRPLGSEALPKGIVTETSKLQMRPLWGSIPDNIKSNLSVNLLAIAAGIKQKEIVNQTVAKFLENDFVVMIFHYDGIVDAWSDLGWSDRVIHIVAMNQTKWWFAKRFLHPDIVVEYDYIFLWDEDLGVDNFHPGRYLSIVKDERLEISQPALDPTKSVVHYGITTRRRNSRVHRRISNAKCHDNNTAPPCVGWVEMMAPVFSRAAWRCVWYMIQNDLIHAWGLDMQLGYCAKGDRRKNVGVVDSEYIAHLELPTLGGSDGNKDPSALQSVNNRTADPSVLPSVDKRTEVRRQSYKEMQIFKNRWNRAVEDDKCWVDPYH